MTIDHAAVSLEDRITALEKRIDFLEKERPGRRMRPNIVSESGVCGIVPDRPSAACPDASIYRYQQGCRGESCVKIHKDYYADYRAKRRREMNPDATVEVNDFYGSSTS